MKINVQQKGFYQHIQVKLNGECLHNGGSHKDTMELSLPNMGIYEHTSVPVLVCDFCSQRIDTHDDELDNYEHDSADFGACNF